MPPPPGRPELPPPGPASNPGMPPLLEPPAPPRRSKQQWVVGLHDESHGLPAWISGSFVRRTVRSLPNVQAGTLPPPLLELLLLVDDVLPPEELDVDPEEEEEEEDVDDVLPPAGCCGMTVLVCSSGVPAPSGMSDPASAQAAAASNIEDVKTRPTIRASFMGVADHTTRKRVDNRRRLSRTF